MGGSKATVSGCYLKSYSSLLRPKFPWLKFAVGVLFLIVCCFLLVRT